MDGVRTRTSVPLALMTRFSTWVGRTPAGESHPPSSQRLLTVLLTAVLIFGAGVRIVHFAQGRVLYNDELYVAKNIRLLSFKELTGPLLHDQRAPMAFLIAVKACWVTIGPNDYALRLVPLLGGLLGLFVFYPAARVFLPRSGALLALAIFAVNEPLTFYSAELKPYAWDALASIVILWVLGPLASRTLTWRYAVLVGLMGLVMPFGSFSSTFSLAASGIALALWLAIARRWNELPRAAVMGALWAVGIAAVQMVQVRHYSNETSGWLWVWVNDFGPRPLARFHTLEWLADHLSTLISNAVGLKSSTLAILGTALGALAFARTRPFHFALLLAPLTMGLVLAIVKFYPFGSRLLLYLYPAMAILIGAAFARLLASGTPEARRWALGAAALLLAPMVVIGVKNSLHDTERKSIANESYSQARIKHAMAFIQKNWQPGDVLYLHNESGMWIEHYADRYGFDRSAVVHGVFTGFWNPSWDQCGDHLARTVKGKPRVWVLLTQQSGFAVNEAVLYRYHLDRMAVA